MAKKKTTKRATAAAVAGASDGSALAIFAVSLRKMANFYSSHPSPGLIRPIDAIQMALCDAAGAAEYAAQGKQWLKPGVWKKPNVAGEATASRNLLHAAAGHFPPHRRSPWVKSQNASDQATASK